MTRLTNPKIFEPKPGVNYRRFSPGADLMPDVILSRTPVGGMRGADGRHLGDPLVTIPQRFVYHSPSGFEWGYGGSGPSDLALNVLALFVDPPEAWRLHHAFKDEFIATMPREGGVLGAREVRDWLQGRWAEDFRRENSQSGR